MRFGNPDFYLEPFAGSLAVLLSRDEPRGIETVNDADCLVTNFWRAAKHRPTQVARASRQPAIQLDMHARHRLLQESKDSIRESLAGDPTWCDARLAGWWLHGVCESFGEAWLHRVYNQKPSMRPYGALLKTADEAKAWLHRIARRLERVRICNGDWSAVLTPIQLGLRERAKKIAAIVLDPPYAGVSVAYGEGGRGGRGMSASVREWAIAHADNERLRIALCGYEGEHEMPNSWECLPWKSGGGLSTNRGHISANRFRERVWFSPGCLKVA